MEDSPGRVVIIGPVLRARWLAKMEFVTMGDRVEKLFCMLGTEPLLSVYKDIARMTFPNGQRSRPLCLKSLRTNYLDDFSRDKIGTGFTRGCIWPMDSSGTKKRLKLDGDGAQGAIVERGVVACDLAQYLSEAS